MLVQNKKVLHFGSCPPLNMSITLNHKENFLNPESELLVLNVDLYTAAAKLCQAGRL